ncbi:PhzF family phenazine biosynthesis protein [Celerinatantimonas sp. YJH-8]|uniref:PhzF family phenazine biosynthesis protein n=1 Tax=Celerinatantimonas sp. YJH-8 TaxID=3228714 RepID=UPI0038C90C36
MQLDIYQIDAFTSLPFKGNPAGVCITQEPLESSLMLSIAKELAISETAFLTLDNMYLRWFTPLVEVELCGHATLATAHVLRELAFIHDEQQVKFNTLSGMLSVHVQGQMLNMNFPEPKLKRIHQYNQLLLNALGLQPSQILVWLQFDGNKDLIVIDNMETIIEMTPNFDLLKQGPGRGVIVTANSNYLSADFVSRYFAPWVGVNEDPVTGSAHCALASYWCQKLARTRLRGYQASSRGGFVDVERLARGRIRISGTAVTMFKGTLSF